MPSDNKGNVKVSARIRCFLPWEQNDKCYEIDEEGRVGLPSKGSHKSSMSGSRTATMQFMKFDKVFDRHEKNLDVFNGTAKGLCDNMIQTGFNALLIAYGQTGSGKTHTLLGSKKRGIHGILGLAVDYLLNHDSKKVVSATMSVLEVYGIKQEKVEMFDLFNRENINDDWDEKQGKSTLTAETVVRNEINGNILELIDLAQSAAHYAPTGKNPHSSRGHTAFVIEVTMSDGHRCDFVCLDLAGSEGMTAITPEFTKKVGQKTAHIRLMEGGAINFGLQQLQKILKQVGSKDGVSKVQGSGLRRLLHPFLQKNKSPMVEVLFTLSPSTTNINSTRSTFRVATTTANLQIIPVKVEKKKTHQQIIAELKKTVRNQEWEIEKLKKELTLYKDKEVSSDEVSNVQVTFDSDDLKSQQSNLFQLKRQLTQKVQNLGGLPNKMTADQHELLSELKEELNEIDEEIEELDQNIENMEELEIEMDQAIKTDLQRNTKMYRRESNNAPASKLRLLGSFAMIPEEDDDDELEDGFVKVSKQELLLLKEQLDTLAINMANKKKEAKQRNADLLQFVDKLQTEQKDLLEKLDSKRSSN